MCSSLALLSPHLCPCGGMEWQIGGTKSKTHGLRQEKYTGDKEIRKLILAATILIKVHRRESDSRAKMHTAAPNLTAAMQKRAIPSGKTSPSPAPSNDVRWYRITSGYWPSKNEHCPGWNQDKSFEKTQYNTPQYNFPPIQSRWILFFNLNW